MNSFTNMKKVHEFKKIQEFEKRYLVQEFQSSQRRRKVSGYF